MIERKRIWLGISAALIAGGSAQASAESVDSAGHSVAAYLSPTQTFAADAQEGSGEATATAEGEGEGEGEAVLPDLAADDVAFLKRLGLIRGHLYVGQTLYGEGLVDMAQTHMKHPRDELYAGLVPAITARGASAFDEALAELADAVESDAGTDAVEPAWNALDEAIRQVEGNTDASMAQQLMAIADMVRTAADEYGIGVVNGRLDNVHEYQDAWGFVQVARLKLDALTGADEDETRAIERASSTLSGVDSLWPGLAPDGAVDGSASVLHGAAARIELAARSLPF